MDSLIISGARKYAKEIYLLLQEEDTTKNVVFGRSYPDNYGYSCHATKVEKITWEDIMTPDEKSNWINFGSKPLTRKKINEIIDTTEYIYYTS